MFVVASLSAAGFMLTAGAAPGVVRLHFGTDGRFFELGSTKQTLTTAKNSCAINSAETVMDLSSTGSQSAPGVGPDAIGVKGTPSSGNGSPCTQIQSSESLTLKPGSSISGRSFTGLRMDLEMAGNATVKLTLSGGANSAVYQLQTGTAITAAQQAESDYDTTAPYTVSSSPGDTVDGCAAPNSSGPNNSINDNCQWSVNPGFTFDTVTLTTVSVGTVQLEGSSDFGGNPDFDTLFYLSNAAPTANNDTAVTNEDTAVSGNVLTNDTDPDGNPLSASLLTNPSHGTVSFAGTGAYTYTPAANYFGSDSFTYTASDGALTSNATVNITVNAVNDAPVANNDTAEVAQNSHASIDVVANDTDVDGDTLTPGTFASVTPAASTVVANADRTVEFTPPAGYTGAASFTYKASDGQTTSNAATVSITVYPVLCSNETVTATDGSVSGSFTRLSDSFECKRYTLDASATDNTVVFQPTGSATVNYRATLSFGSDPAPPAGGSGGFTLLLRYDPSGGNDFRPVQWCVDPQFDSGGNVTSATIPAGETWCIASADTRPVSGGNLATIWQVYGQDDPKFTR